MNEKTKKIKGGYIFTSESVTPGHPDKICDQISDAVVEAAFAQDPKARVACECFVTTDFLVMGGEITTTAKLDYEQIARDTIKKIGYTREGKGFDYNCEKL